MEAIQGFLVSTPCLGTMTFGDCQGIYKHIGNVGQAPQPISDSVAGLADR